MRFHLLGLAAVASLAAATMLNAAPAQAQTDVCSFSERTSVWGGGCRPSVDDPGDRNGFGTFSASQPSGGSIGNPDTEPDRDHKRGKRGKGWGKHRDHHGGKGWGKGRDRDHDGGKGHGHDRGKGKAKGKDRDHDRGKGKGGKGHDHGKGWGKDRDHDRGKGKGWGKDRDHDRGKGWGKGRDHDRGKGWGKGRDHDRGKGKNRGKGKGGKDRDRR